MKRHVISDSTKWSCLLRRLGFNIFYSEEDGGYIADIPDLEVCSAFGATPAETLREVEIARDVWIETAKQSGKPIPEPRYRPPIYLTA